MKLSRLAACMKYACLVQRLLVQCQPHVQTSVSHRNVCRSARAWRGARVVGQRVDLGAHAGYVGHCASEVAAGSGSDQMHAAGPMLSALHTQA